MKNLFRISVVLILVVSSIIYFTSCKKEPSPPTLTTASVSAITQTTATSGGNITSDGGAEVTARGVCWNTSQNPTVAHSKTSDGTGGGAFTSNLTGLTPGTEYYVRAYATNEAGTSYGNQQTFTSGDILLPTLTTTAASSVTLTSAVTGGNISADGGADITARGVCWSTSENPTTTDNKTEDGTGTGSFTSDLTGLTPGTQYYVRAYATNSAGTAYGNQVDFSTEALQLATVTTAAADQITQTSVVLGGDVTDDGGAEVTAKGICWSTSTDPTTDDNTTIDGTGTGAFTTSLDGLTPGTTYYVKAYAINGVGTAYGNEVTFDTDPVELATVTTDAISDATVTNTSAVAGGEVTDDGGGAVTAKGVCWSTSQSPTIDDDYTDEGPGIGIFSSNITSLSEGTTYYVRAYATNSAGTAYGNEVSFTTDEIILATLTTVNASAISTFTALSGGNITDDGGADITARGVCWSTTANPTVSDNVTNDGSGIGSYTSSISGLNASTTYYVRAYATNSAGPAYGTQISFTTTESLTDIDGNIYATVILGTQVWMADPLATSTFSDDTEIPLVTDATAWSNLTTPGYCFYNNDEATYGETYGALYNWYAVNAGNICPDGWRVPTADDWSILVSHIGGISNGGKLKETGTVHWESPNTGATNETGFTALPGGYRSISGGFVNMGRWGHWWTPAEYDETFAWYRYLSYNNGILYTERFNKKVGFSIRCIKE